MVAPAEVHATLRRHLLVDGFDLVLDTHASRGSVLIDARDGARHLDVFSFFASSALGMNHPTLTEDADFLATLTEVAVNKPSNSDVYTTHLAAFTETFARIAGDPALPHLFFIDGGALAVENALKGRLRLEVPPQRGARPGPWLGPRVLHLTRAFHGRTGYTLSLTNIDPFKTDRFPTFDWPRIAVPTVRFPVGEHRDEVEAAGRRALEQARFAFGAYPHDIACFVAAPIRPRPPVLGRQP